jgi:hypothetical protein
MFIYKNIYVTLVLIKCKTSVNRILITNVDLT